MTASEDVKIGQRVHVKTRKGTLSGGSTSYYRVHSIQSHTITIEVVDIETGNVVAPLQAIDTKNIVAI